jgi:hypothetical protein
MCCQPAKGSKVPGGQVPLIPGNLSAGRENFFGDIASRSNKGMASRCSIRLGHFERPICLRTATTELPTLSTAH